jgi:hypothetical protein
MAKKSNKTALIIGVLAFAGIGAYLLTRKTPTPVLPGTLPHPGTTPTPAASTGPSGLLSAGTSFISAISNLFGGGSSGTDGSGLTAPFASPGLSQTTSPIVSSASGYSQLPTSNGGVQIDPAALGDYFSNFAE